MFHIPQKKIHTLGIVASIIAIVFSFTTFVLAQTTSTPDPTALNEKIESRRKDIEALEKEIEQDRAELSKLSGQKNSLANEIKVLDLTRTKLQKEISVTTNKISITDSELIGLGDSIAEKETRRIKTVASLAQTVRSLRETDDLSLVETLLSSKTLSEIWEDVDMINSLQTALSSNLSLVIALKADLETKKTETEGKRKELASYHRTLADQKSVVDYTTRQKNTLLGSVKSKESEYQKLVAAKLAKKQAFEKELLDIEAELRYITDPSMIPPAQPGMLRWPLASIKVTQQFGDTDFSRANPGVYSGKGHNGTDFGAPIGTPILAAQSGVIEGIGDTDKTCPGASYGKWILIRHKNGLSTLYAHLSVIRAEEGQSVEAGQTIGYVGLTGYTTGPHLHFTVYATAGVKIVDRKSAVCGGTYHMPIADLRAYLNPLLYLPS